MEETIIEILKIIYSKINFGKLKVKNPHELFTNKVLVSSRKPTIKMFVGKLCSYMGINYIPKEILDKIDYLVENYSENDVLNKIHDEYMYLSMSGIMASKNKTLGEEEKKHKTRSLNEF